MDRKTNEAIAAFRKVIKAERKARQADEELNRRVEGLTSAQMLDYVNATTAVTVALAAVGDEDASEVEFRAALNHAGTDA